MYRPIIKYGIRIFFFLNVNKVIKQIDIKNITLIIIPIVKLILNVCKHNPVNKSNIGLNSRKIATIVFIFFFINLFIIIIPFSHYNRFSILKGTKDKLNLILFYRKSIELCQYSKFR